MIQNHGRAFPWLTLHRCQQPIVQYSSSTTSIQRVTTKRILPNLHQTRPTSIHQSPSLLRQSALAKHLICVDVWLGLIDLQATYFPRVGYIPRHVWTSYAIHPHELFFLLLFYSFVDFSFFLSRFQRLGLFWGKRDSDCFFDTAGFYFPCLS